MSVSFLSMLLPGIWKKRKKEGYKSITCKSAKCPAIFLPSGCAKLTHCLVKGWHSFVLVASRPLFEVTFGSGGGYS